MSINNKVCSDCQQEKSENDFYRKGNRLQSKCKECFNAYCVKRWIRHKVEAIEYKGNKCFDCGISYPYPVYDFHHLDPNEKDVDWGKLRLRSKKKRFEELDKCVLLCSNCHRLRHHNS